MKDIKDLYKLFGEPSTDDDMKSIANIFYDMGAKEESEENENS